MSPRLVTPAEAAAGIARRLSDSWAERVCAEVDAGPQAAVAWSLMPGISTSADIERTAPHGWGSWKVAWSQVDLTGLPGVSCEYREVSVRRVPARVPLRLHIDDLDAGLQLLGPLGHPGLDIDIARARTVARRLLDAGAMLTSRALSSVCRLPDADVDVTVEVVNWLREHPDLSGSTIRQLAVPQMHTKWLGRHAGLIRLLTNRHVAAEARPRLGIVLFSYVDPVYRAGGGRHHDAWTTGDCQELAYRPRTVLVVENRDCRLWFPEVPDTIVVEGDGDAVVAAASRLEWLIEAEQLVYWGDIDADGFAILNSLRAELEPLGARVDSILMDAPAHARYAALGVDRDKNGKRLKPSSVWLPHLSDAEAACYASVATAGDVTFRRIEQERIPFEDAAAALRSIIDRR